MVWINDIEVTDEEEIEEHIMRMSLSPELRAEVEQILKLLYELGCR